MRKLSFVFAFLCLCVFVFSARAQNSSPAGRRVGRQPLPPEAFTTPTNYVLIVNHAGAVNTAWLAEQCEYMSKQLRVAVLHDSAEGVIHTDPRAFVATVRARHEGKAKIVLVLSEEATLTPMLTAPYEHWVIMDAAWVKAGGGDEEVLNLRMGKRVFQAFGHCVGAGYRMEREAVMRYTPTPEALDECLSHGFHPLNSNAFMIVQQAIGLDSVRLRPRQELIDMGIIQPRVP